MYFLIVVEARSKIKVLATLLSPLLASVLASLVSKAPLLIRTLVRTDLGLALIVSFQLNCFFKGPVSKYSHILRSWGLGLQHLNFRGTQFSPYQFLTGHRCLLL